MTDRPAVTELHSGPYTAVLDGPVLRDLRVAGAPALDAVYVAVRDERWQTLPARVRARRIQQRADGFRIDLRVSHADRFAWDGTVRADGDELVFSMDGRVAAPFNANRIGFCLEHPLELAGRSVVVTGPRGRSASAFPRRISPTQVFRDLQAMTCTLTDATELEIVFTGDLFETEDHRNWTDPGWKTYCTPLDRPIPVAHRSGDRVGQSVRLSVRTAGAPSATRPRGESAVQVGDREVGRLPGFGLGTSGLAAPSPAALAAVRALRPEHLHAELIDGVNWLATLRRAAAEATAVGVPLDVGLVGGADVRPAMLAELRTAGVRVGRCTAFEPAGPVTDPAAAASLRTVADAVGAGSRANFAELNRAGLDPTGWDFLSFAANPQVHHDADRDLLATVRALPDCVAQAGQLAGGRPVVLGPVTLRPRADSADGDPPGPDVDLRQHGVIAAVYLAGVAAGAAGAEHVTAYRSIGRRGVVTAAGRRLPAADVLAALTARRGRPVLATRGDHRGLATLAVRTPDGIELLLADLIGRPRPVRITGATPDRLHALVGSAELTAGTVRLGAHAVARLWCSRPGRG